MPKQEIYLELRLGNELISVLKTCDESFAKEVFDLMDDSALQALVLSLRLKDNYECEDIPDENSADYRDFLWEALVDAAQEDGHVKSYFVVEMRSAESRSHFAFVSGDWPSAERFAKALLHPNRVSV